MFHRCGVWDFELGGDGKNGEAIYIGTAPEQLYRNPTTDPDASNSNWIHHNLFDTQGNECVDIKEFSEHNIIEYNHCTGQRDSDAAGMASRGNYNIFRFNTIWGNAGAGIRLGGDTPDQGIHNTILFNTLLNNAFTGLKIMASPQSSVCGNTIRPFDKAMRGSFVKQLELPQACSP